MVGLDNTAATPAKCKTYPLPKTESYPMASFYPSVSTIETFITCGARGLAKLQGHREPESDAMREGTRNHRLVQSALVTGKPISPLEVAAVSVLRVLPVGLGDVEPHNVERVLVLPGWHGYIDWAAMGWRHGDLKFTSNVRNQVKKNPAEDPQRIVYALDHFYRTGDRRTAQTWSVAQFNGKNPKRLDFFWTPKTAKAAYEKIIAKPLDKLNEHLHSGTHWNDAPKNLAACDKYPPNGCPMVGLGCKRSLSQRLIQLQPGKIKV